MDILLPLVKSLVGDGPPNRWTAVICSILCLTYLCAQLIRLKYQVKVQGVVEGPISQPLMALPPAEHKLKPPTASELSIWLLFLFGAGFLGRLGINMVETHQGVVLEESLARAADGGRKKAGPLHQKCSSDADCPRGQTCDSRTCSSTAKKPPPNPPQGTAEAFYRPWTDATGLDLRAAGMPIGAQYQARAW